MFSNKRGNVSRARKMCFALMKEHLNITDEEIGGYFGGKARQFVNNQLSSLPINKDKYKNKKEEVFFWVRFVDVQRHVSVVLPPIFPSMLPFCTTTQKCRRFTMEPK